MGSGFRYVANPATMKPLLHASCGEQKEKRCAAIDGPARDPSVRGRRSSGGTWPEERVLGA